MVSRRNFFTIMILLAVMTFMFMFVSVIKYEYNRYDVNEHGLGSTDAAELGKNRAILLDRLQTKDVNRAEVIYLTGSRESSVDGTVENWCVYTKQTLQTRNSLGGITFESLPRVVIVNGEQLTLEKDEDTLLELAQRGVCVIFATMPQPKIIENSSVLRRLMGITNVYSESIWLDGMHLFSGLLIGGEAIYEGDIGTKNREDKEFQVPWYMVGAGTKTYMMGTVNESEFENQFLPTILWRNSVGDGRVFCVNGNFMSHPSGTGLLTAFLAEADSYYIYPVVNAQNLVLADYGGFSEENSQMLNEVYNQPQSSFFRENVWPTIIALNERTSARISMMAAFQMDYDDGAEPLEGRLVYYLRLLKENGGEAGLTTNRFSEISLKEKLDRDLSYWRREAQNYEIRSVFLKNPEEIDTVKEKLPDVRTVICAQEETAPIRYLDETLTVQMATSQGVKYEFLDDFSNKAYETALGYSCIVLDMLEAAYPKNGYYWETLSKKITSNLSTHWRDYTGFEQTTVSESDARIRRFFALDYSSSREENTIKLHVEGLGEGKGYFVLKLNGEKPDEKAESICRSLGNGFYLLEIDDQDTEIGLTREKSTIY